MNGQALGEEMKRRRLRFTQKPILIGGMAMEYYGIRKSGPDIDLVICNSDYEALAQQYPENRKDIWGDLGVVIGPFEIWRCIMLLDYDFYKKDAIEEDDLLVVSLDRLLLTRVLAMDNPKYNADLRLMKDYYCQTFFNKEYAEYQAKHIALYQKSGGIIWGGNYSDET